MIVNTFQLLIFSPLMILGALGNQWSVKYSPENLCAVKGSTVVMNGTYTHPTHVTVTNRFWVKDSVKDQEPTDLRKESGYSDRVEYSGDEQNHFSLRLSDVKKTDKHEYCIRVKGNENYLFHPGIILRVTEFRVEAPETVVEGNVTVLMCDTTCSPSDTPAFIWYKDDIKIIGKIISGNTLILKPTKADDAGGYSCAVRGYEDLRSPARSLSVKYRPKNISVSVSPSGEKVEGSSVTLTCSSDAIPPVENYTWFKEKESSPVGSGQSYRALQSGLYYCEVQNKLGSERSAAVSITINDGSVIVFVAVGLGLLALAALLSVLFWLRWRRHKNNPDEGYYQNVGLRAKDDTYAALDPAGRKSDDVYHTLAVAVT